MGSRPGGYAEACSPAEDGQHRPWLGPIGLEWSMLTSKDRVLERIVAARKHLGPKEARLKRVTMSLSLKTITALLLLLHSSDDAERDGTYIVTD